MAQIIFFIHIILLISHWPELSHMAMPDFKGAQEMQSLVGNSASHLGVGEVFYYQKKKKGRMNSGGQLSFCRSRVWELKTTLISGTKHKFGDSPNYLRFSNSLEGLRTLANCCNHGYDLFSERYRLKPAKEKGTWGTQVELGVVLSQWSLGQH